MQREATFEFISSSGFRLRHVPYPWCHHMNRNGARSFWISLAEVTLNFLHGNLLLFPFVCVCLSLKCVVLVFPRSVKTSLMDHWSRSEVGDKLKVQKSRPVILNVAQTPRHCLINGSRIIEVALKHERACC